MWSILEISSSSSLRMSTRSSARCVASRLKKGHQLLAFGIGGDERGQVVCVLLDQLYGAGQIADFRLPQAVRCQRGRNVDAIEHVADVVEHAGGDFGHSGTSGRSHELLLRCGQFMFGPQAIRDLALQLFDSLERVASVRFSTFISRSSLAH